jgi:hypothetical protein
MGGVLASTIFFQIVWTASGLKGGGLQSAHSGTSFLLLANQLLALGWQAWLLFRKHPVRFAGWVALSSCLNLIYFVPTLHQVAVYQTTLFIVPIVQAMIIRGVRERAWAWVLASVIAVLINRFVSPHVWMPVTTFIRQLAAAVGLNNIPTPHVAAGLSMLTQAMVAAVLAWKMPAVRTTLAPAQFSAEQPVASENS